jgi:hypothetical protein
MAIPTTDAQLKSALLAAQVSLGECESYVRTRTGSTTQPYGSAEAARQLVPAVVHAKRSLDAVAPLITRLT